MKRKRTQKQESFIQEYLIDKNATQAAIRAGYSQKTAKMTGYENLTKPYIQEAIKKGLAKLADKLEITQERVLKELARIAFFDPAKMLDEDGSVLPLHEMDEGTRAVIAGMDVEVLISKRGKTGKQTGTIKKIKIANKLTALDQLGKHLGLFEQDNLQRNQDIHIYTGVPEPDPPPREDAT